MRQPLHYRGPRPARGATPAQFESLAAVVLTGSYADAARLRGISEPTIKRHMGDLHRRTGLLTSQLAYAFRDELTLYFATHKWPTEPIPTEPAP